MKETVFEGRFKHVDELNVMGADISVDLNAAFIRGVPRLYGATVEATDLRAGAGSGHCWSGCSRQNGCGASASY